MRRLLFAMIRTFGGTRHPYELEALLRPPLELSSAGVAASAAALFISTPGLFMMSAGYGLIVGTAIALFACRRLCQGSYIWLYQRSLNKMKPYKVSLLAIHRQHRHPWKIYVGQGFQWTHQHAQRHYDLQCLPEYAGYIRHQETEVGGRRYIHGVGCFDIEDCYLSLSDRIGHVLMYGQSRSGKTRAIELFLSQDIANGYRVIMIDPKGDKDLFKRLLLEAKRAGRLDDVMVLHLGFIAQSVRYNPLRSYQRVAEVAGRIASKLPSSGDSQAFAMFAWRFIYVVASAMEVIGETITIKQLKTYITELDRILERYVRHDLGMDEAAFNQAIKPIDASRQPQHLSSKSPRAARILAYIQQNNIEPDEILSNIISAYSYEKTYYDKITASLLPFLEQLASFDEMTSPSGFSEIPELVLQEAIAQNKLIYFGLDGLSDQQMAHAFGSMFFADMVSTAGRLYKEKETLTPIIVHADEFNDVIGDDFIPLLNKAAGAGIIVHAYTQTDHDIDLGFESSTKSMVAKGNFRTVATLRVATEETARFFTQRVPEINVKYATTDSRITDSSSKRIGTSAVTADSIKNDKIPLVEAATIMSQPVGQAFLAKNGGMIYHIRFPLVDEDLTELVGSIEQAWGLGEMIYRANTGCMTFKEDLATQHSGLTTRPRALTSTCSVLSKRRVGKPEFLNGTCRQPVTRRPDTLISPLSASDPEMVNTEAGCTLTAWQVGSKPSFIKRHIQAISHV